jgi:Transcriptional antiterminator
MAELFLSSLPGSIPIKIISYNNFKLIQNSDEDGILKKYHVLTIIGTSNPNIQGVPFIALEDIISLKEIKQINAFLVRYFTQDEIQQFNRNILKNFSLQNVMQYLTVLNADKLLDYIEVAVNHLQQLMGKKLGGETILGIYVHLSCLVERLVTKNQLETHINLKGFESSQQVFIKQMRESFSVIQNHYGVEIPVSEIAYIYDYIANDEIKTREDDVL